MKLAAIHIFMFMGGCIFGQYPVILPYPTPELHVPKANDVHFNASLAVSSGVLMFLSGAAHGVSETLTWHYDSFQKQHPKASERYWNPRVSWVNKYKTDQHGNIILPRRPAYFGSTTFLVWNTDGLHAMNAVSRLSGVAGVTIPLWTGSGKKLKHYAVEVAGKALFWSVGFHTTYSVIYNH